MLGFYSPIIIEHRLATATTIVLLSGFTCPVRSCGHRQKPISCWSRHYRSCLRTLVAKPSRPDAEFQGRTAPSCSPHDCMWNLRGGRLCAGAAAQWGAARSAGALHCHHRRSLKPSPSEPQGEWPGAYSRPLQGPRSSTVLAGGASSSRQRLQQHPQRRSCHRRSACRRRSVAAAAAAATSIAPFVMLSVQLPNCDFKQISCATSRCWLQIGRAGSSRWMGRRPTVRGVAMNSVDHPHGGGRYEHPSCVVISDLGSPHHLSHHFDRCSVASAPLPSSPTLGTTLGGAQVSQRAASTHIPVGWAMTAFSRTNCCPSKTSWLTVSVFCVQRQVEGAHLADALGGAHQGVPHAAQSAHRPVHPPQPAQKPRQPAVTAAGGRACAAGSCCCTCLRCIRRVTVVVHHPCGGARQRLLRLRRLCLARLSELVEAGSPAHMATH